MILACVVALIGITGCSDDDDPVDLNGSAADVAAAEAALNVALDEIADPLEFLGQLIEMLNPNPAPPGTSRVVPCPVSCLSGEIACTEAGVLNVTFTNCEISGSDMTVDGAITVNPLTLSATFTEVSINGSAAMNGTASISNDTSCRLTLTELSIGDSEVNGNLFVCEEDDWPSAESALVITVVANGDVYVITMDFDGTSTAGAGVTKNGIPVATCNVNLDTLVGSCSSV
jgi:hypothetical protein